MKLINSVGILGLGSMGRFIATILPASIRVIGYDEKEVSNLDHVDLASFEEVVKADIVILAIPLESYELVLPKLNSLLSPHTLLVDICSVKTIPQQYFEKYLPKHQNVLMTHPLFGPQSAANGTGGHQLIVTRSTGINAEIFLEFCKEILGLNINHMTTEEHDRIMAQVHVLTFFMARGLGNMKLEDGPFVTPSYRMITDLIEFDHSHSKELFETIQLGNPYAAEMRQQIVESFQEIDQDLMGKKLLGSDK